VVIVSVFGLMIAVPALQTASVPKFKSSSLRTAAGWVSTTEPLACLAGETGAACASAGATSAAKPVNRPRIREVLVI
jgi:hypothetical protein